MSDEKKGGFLVKAFMGAAKIATLGLAAAVGWQLFLDPLFFQPIHDPFNTDVQAFVAMMNDWFGWIPNLVGFTGDGGLLKSTFMQSVLGPYKTMVAVADKAEINDFFHDNVGEISLDMLGG